MGSNSHQVSHKKVQCNYYNWSVVLATYLEFINYRMCYSSKKKKKIENLEQSSSTGRGITEHAPIQGEFMDTIWIQSFHLPYRGVHLGLDTMLHHFWRLYIVGAITLLEKCSKGCKLDNSRFYDELRSKRPVVVKWSNIILLGWSTSNLPKHFFNLWLCMLGKLCTN